MKRKKNLYGDGLLKIEILLGFHKDNFYNHPSLFGAIDLRKIGTKNLFISIENYTDKSSYTPEEIVEGVNIFKKDYQTNGFKIPKCSSLLVYQSNFSPIIIYTGYEVSKNIDRVVFAINAKNLVEIRQLVPNNYEIIIIGKKAEKLTSELISFGFDEKQVINIYLDQKENEGILITNKRGIIKH
jgi:hypothetical protein